MQPDNRHAKAPGLRPRSFASPQTTDARWLPIHRHALSSTHRCGIPLDSAVESQQFCSHHLSTFCFRELWLRNGRFARDPPEIETAFPLLRNASIWASIRERAVETAFSMGSEFLPCQFSAEILFLLGNVLFVATRIDERVRASLFHESVLFLESEVAAMGTE